jgi:hypothetical protein
MSDGQLTDGELLGRLMDEIGMMSAVAAEALEAAETTPLIRKGLGSWLAQTAMRFTLTAGAGMVLEQVELTDTWREGICLMLGIRDGGGRHGHGVSADADLAGG